MAESGGGRQLRSMSETTRRATRFAVAAFFWANAFFLIRFQPASFSRWAAGVNLTTAEAVIILVIAVVTLLRSNGLWKFSVDLTYLYFFPFVLLFYAWRLLRAALRLTRFIPAGTAVAKAGQQLAPEGNAVEVSTSTIKPATEESSPSATKRVLDFGVTFFLRSTLLWGLLIVFSSHKVLLEVATVVVLIHPVRALYMAGGICWLSYKRVAGSHGQRCSDRGFFARENAHGAGTSTGLRRRGWRRP